MTADAQTPYRLAVVAYHPVPYQVPLYRRLEREPAVEATVYYLSRAGVAPRYEPDWNATVAWDVPLLEGYRYRFLRNWTWDEEALLIRRLNPGLVPRLARGGYDAVLVTGYDTASAYLALLGARLGGSAAMLRAEADLGRVGATFRSRLKQRYLPRVLGWFDAVMYTCRANHAYFRHFGVPEARLFPLPSAADNAALEAAAAERPTHRREVRQAHGIPDAAAVIAFAGRLTQRKRPLDLVDAFAEIAHDSPEAWLLIVGDGPLRSELEARVAERGIPRVVFAGFRNASAMPAYLLASDVLVLPSSYDPTPKVLHEAAALGLPLVVSSGVGTAGDFVEDDAQGYVVETGDTGTLAARLRTLAAEPALRRRMGESAAAQARAWSPEAGVRGILAALRAVRPR